METIIRENQMESNMDHSNIGPYSGVPIIVRLPV